MLLATTRGLALFLCPKKNKMGQINNLTVVTWVGDGKRFEDEVIEKMTILDLSLGPQMGVKALRENL
jgi:hypothetical protein